MVQGLSYGYFNNSGEIYMGLDQGGRDVGEEKWFDFKFILRKILEFVEGLETGYVIKIEEKDGFRFLVLFIS